MKELFACISKKGDDNFDYSLLIQLKTKLPANMVIDYEGL